MINESDLNEYEKMLKAFSLTDQQYKDLPWQQQFGISLTWVSRHSGWKIGNDISIGGSAA